MSRIPEVAYEEMSGEQREVHDRIASGPRGGVYGPLRIWLRSPALAERLQSLGEFCRYNTSLPPRLSELAILTTAVVWQAGFEWTSHEKHGLAAGLAPEVLEKIRRGEQPDLADAGEAIVYDLTRELSGTRTLSAATYERAVAVLGEVALVELVGLLGYYATISMTINAFDVAITPGAREPFRS